MYFEYAYGATPIDSEEALDLIPSHINTQKELNEWEQRNILEAQKWAFSRKISNMMSIKFCCDLHKRMFNHTWKWAGKFRHTNKNIGVFWEQVPMQLKSLLDDVSYQIDHKIFDIDEIATRFHHRLVSIHPFPNGNGRHARLYTDLILSANNRKRFSWGSHSLDNNTECRKNYIDALRAADQGYYELLLHFTRS